MKSLPEVVRILQVVTQMNRAGLETMLMNYYRNVNRSQIQFDFLVHREGCYDYDKEISQLGGNIYHIRPITPKGFWSYLQDLRHFFLEHKEYKIVHSHLDALSSFVLLEAKHAGIHIRIAHSHNTAFTKDKKYFLRLLSKYMLPLGATHYFACSQEAALFLFPKSIARLKCRIIKNAIELDRFRFNFNIREAKRQELEIRKETFVIGHVGRFCIQKNHDKVIHIFMAIHRKNPDSILFLVGQGELEKNILNLCMQLGIQDSVRFLGVRDDIDQLMQAFDLFLLPSFYEGFPVVGVEAQAAGLPCLMSNRIKEDVALIDSTAFLPLEAEDVVWAKKALELRQLPRKDTRKELSTKGFDIKEQAILLQNFYFEVEDTLSLGRMN